MRIYAAILTWFLWSICSAFIMEKLGNKAFFIMIIGYIAIPYFIFD